MRKKLFLVLVAVGLICFLSLEADAKKVVSKEERKEKIGNQLVVEKERMTKMKIVNETGYHENSGYGDDKFVEKDQDHDEDGEDEDDKNGDDEDGDDINSGFRDHAENRTHHGVHQYINDANICGHAENRTHRMPPFSKEVHDPQN